MLHSAPLRLVSVESLSCLKVLNAFFVCVIPCFSFSLHLFVLSVIADLLLPLSLTVYNAAYAV